jgi:hypothetical protein
MVDNGRASSRDPFIAPQVAIPSPSPRDQRWAQVTRPQEDLGGIPKLHLSPDSMIQLDLGAGSTATEPVGLDGDDSRIPRLVHDQARGQPTRSERPSDEQITEFIRILFDEILDDPRLHPDVRHDLGLLRPSVLRIAIRDPDLLRSHRHPCWLFLNRVASHCIGYEYADDARLVAFLKFFSEVLGDLAYEALPETRLYEAQLERMEAWLHAKQSEQLAADHQKIQKLQRSEQMNHLRAWIDGQLQQHPSQHQEHRRFEAERGRVGGERVQVLGSADGAATIGPGVDQTDLAHALQVGANSVGVQPQRVGDLGGGERARRAGQLQVDRVAGVVPQRLEQVEPALGGGHGPRLTG